MHPGITSTVIAVATFAAPVAGQCQVNETESIYAAVGADLAGFGTAIATDGTRIVVGAVPHPYSPDVGSAHVLRLVDGAWVEEAVLVPSEGVWEFGRGVDIDGDLIVVDFRDEQADGNSGNGILYLNNTTTDPPTMRLHRTLALRGPPESR